ncbi:MAG: excinuclease ABC subunit C, partial [Candidatus Aenigmarchaeota archaeon]|nr:excinuclease ABC subunit C [Candidatus Aenigmarchaeota archaeon]
LKNNENIEAEILFVRGGVLAGKKDISFKQNQEEDEDYVHQFIKQFYLSCDKIIPEFIFVNVKIDKERNKKSEEELKLVFAKIIKIRNPRTNIQKQLMELAIKNASLNSKISDYRKQKNKDVLEELKKMLSLPKLPSIIHAFDVSTIQGSFNVGASVCFVDAKPSKKDYRKFNIKSIQTQNDCRMIEEIVYRRYRSALEKDEALPDLIIIDGGKAQLNSAKKALNTLNLKIPFIGLAKKEEEIFIPNKKESLKFDKNIAPMRLLIRARDEVHRFVVNFHRKKRDALN